jgi:hypothetical protein
MPDTNNLREEGFIWFIVSEVSVIVVGRVWQSRAVCIRVPGKQRQTMPALADIVLPPLFHLGPSH